MKTTHTLASYKLIITPQGSSLFHLEEMGEIVQIIRAIISL